MLGGHVGFDGFFIPPFFQYHEVAFRYRLTFRDVLVDREEFVLQAALVGLALLDQFGESIACLVLLVGGKVSVAISLMDMA